ncbi:phosphopantetheine-binding protein [Ruminococcaceae bacterium OttesenSCG-928-N02]|nr:phosphopantetheine-binding protein [Ruminococcaceae bacterium OttesenSCG-928-N02]
MSEQEIFDAVQEIFRDIFDEDDLTITRATTAADIEDWDSLEQINLLVAMEGRFKIKFKLEDVSNLADVGDMLDLIVRLVNQ